MAHHQSEQQWYFVSPVGAIQNGQVFRPQSIRLQDKTLFLTFPQRPSEVSLVRTPISQQGEPIGESTLERHLLRDLDEDDLLSMDIELPPTHDHILAPIESTPGSFPTNTAVRVNMFQSFETAIETTNSGVLSFIDNGNLAALMESFEGEELF